MIKQICEADSPARFSTFMQLCCTKNKQLCFQLQFLGINLFNRNLRIELDIHTKKRYRYGLSNKNREKLNSLSRPKMRKKKEVSN
uniref:Uncharacterized protein n=1 Tax=Rhizophora mucronata TaxID=61149 RepID=A0A2P2IXE0_RHIMU